MSKGKTLVFFRSFGRGDVEKGMGFGVSTGLSLYCWSSSHSGGEFSKEFWGVEVLLRYP